jgi:hypothetical protein
MGAHPLPPPPPQPVSQPQLLARITAPRAPGDATLSISGRDDTELDGAPSALRAPSSFIQAASSKSLIVALLVSAMGLRPP